MKHEKEWYTCDRCGAEIEKVPSDAQWYHFIRKITCKPAELEVLTAEKCGYVNNTKLISPEVASAEICEFYNTKKRNVHLCGQCREDFERFMEG